MPKTKLKPHRAIIDLNKQTLLAGLQSERAIKLVNSMDELKVSTALKNIISYADKFKEEEDKTAIGLSINKIIGSVNKINIKNILLKSKPGRPGLDVLSGLFKYERSVNDRIKVLEMINQEVIEGREIEDVDERSLPLNKIVPVSIASSRLLEKAGKTEEAADLNIETLELQLGRPLDKGDLSSFFSRATSRGLVEISEILQFPSMSAGYYWCGPGTDVYGNIKNGKFPTNALDQACYFHDLDYTRLSSANDGLTEEQRGDGVRKSDEDLLSRIRSTSAEVLTRDGMEHQEAMEYIADASKLGKAIALKIRMEDNGIMGKTSFLGPFVERYTEEELQQKIDGVEEEVQVVMDNEAFRKDFPREMRKITEVLSGESKPTEIIYPDNDIMSSTERDRRRAGGAGGGGGGDNRDNSGPPPPPSPQDSVTTTTPLVMDFNMGNKLLGGAPIVGDRNLAPFVVYSNGDELKKTLEQRNEDVFNYENFMWVDEPNSNVHRLPMYDYRASKITDNYLIDARMRSEQLKYSSPLLMQGEVKKETYPSQELLNRISPTYIPTAQMTQQFIRTSSRERKFGPIQMYRSNPYLSEYKNQNSKFTRLTNPDVVNGTVRV
jgi:hypothetical protein